MAHLFASNESQHPVDGYVVRRPRATDGLASSLRKAFDDQMKLPSDLDRLLHSLDRVN